MVQHALAQRSPTECGVSECDRDVSIMIKPWPIRGCCAMGGGKYALVLKVPSCITDQRVFIVMLSF